MKNSKVILIYVEYKSRDKMFVNINEFDKFLVDATTPLISYKGEILNLFLILPEKCIPTFKGTRYSYNQFEKQVCYFNLLH